MRLSLFPDIKTNKTPEISPLKILLFLQKTMVWGNYFPNMGNLQFVCSYFYEVLRLPSLDLSGDSLSEGLQFLPL